MIQQQPMIAVCDRCGRQCHVGVPTHKDAQLLKKSSVPKGLCANCATTQFLMSVEPIAYSIERRGKEILLDPRVRMQFVALLAVGMSDADPSEISWQTIVDNWHLPFPKVRRTKKR